MRALRGEWFPIVALGVFGAAIVGVYGVAFERVASPYTGDSAPYIEAARSLLRGEPLLISDPTGGREMIRLWPPGFSLLTALAASLFGSPPEIAAVALTRAGLALCLAAVYWALSPGLGRLRALIGGILCLSAPGLLSNANLASTDAPYCLVAALALGCVIRGQYGLAGLSVGVALALRNAGIALIGAVALTAIFDTPSIREGVRRVGILALGASFPVAALFGWNLWAHGSLFPYALPPSTRSLADNLKDMGVALAFDTIPAYSLSRAMPWLVPLGASLGICAGVLGYAVLGLQKEALARRTLVAGAAYFGLGLVMTVAARTRYQWGEEIGMRHAAQYDWLLLPIFAAAVAFSAPRLQRPARNAVVALALLVIGARSAEVLDRWRTMYRYLPETARIVETGLTNPADAAITMRQYMKVYTDSAPFRSLARSLSPRCAVFSNLYDLLRARFGVYASEIEHFTEPRDSERPTVVIVAITPDTAVTPGGISAWSAPSFSLVPIPQVPPSVRVFSNAAGDCISS